MADATPAEKKKKFRSPPYPVFDLGKAVERTAALDKVAQHHEVGVSALIEAWNMKSAEGQVWRTAAALIQFGLLSDSGTGKTRKFKITDTGRRIVRDPDPHSKKREEALKSAALRPMIHKVLWDKYGDANSLADTVLKGYLTLDRIDEGDSPYSDSAADEVIASYRKSLAYASLTDSDKDDGDEGEENGKLSHKNPPASNTPQVKVGDLVKWTSGGVDQFEARRIVWISDDGEALRVIGSNTGIPMSEVTKVEAANAPPVIDAEQKLPVREKAAATKPEGGKKPLDASTSILNGRLQVTADVGADEIDALIEVLNKYKEILKLMN